MKLPRLLLVCLPLIVLAASAAPSFAEIYTWKDANGNTHFGDKPTTGRAADNAEKVDVREAYQPTQNLTDEERALERQEQATRNRLDGLRKKDAQAPADSKKSEREKALKEACAKYFEGYQDLKGIRVKNGTPTLTYLVGDDGESLTSLEQDALVEEMRQKLIDANCPQIVDE